jgi:hypothetical protein
MVGLCIKLEVIRSHIIAHQTMLDCKTDVLDASFTFVFRESSSDLGRASVVMDMLLTSQISKHALSGLEALTHVVGAMFPQSCEFVVSPSLFPKGHNSIPNTLLHRCYLILLFMRCCMFRCFNVVSCLVAWTLFPGERSFLARPLGLGGGCGGI